jgi:hypothetical protein
MNKRGETNCRACDRELGPTILDLGEQPLSNELISKPMDGDLEAWPLELKICTFCKLGQIGEFASPSRIFSTYTYFSSTSTYWLAHSKEFAKKTIEKMNLNKTSLVLEIASNDGYMLQYFQEFGIKVLGIEPAKNVAEVAINKGIPTDVDFFGYKKAIELIENGLVPDLVICNNVVAHVPDINDFFEGLTVLINHGSTISIEAPSLLEMLKGNMFDTIYHEHFSYLSINAIQYLSDKYGISLQEVENIPTHGGSIRYWLAKKYSKNERVESAMHELSMGVNDRDLHEQFRVNSERAILEFKNWVNGNRGSILGFGAAAKATVLLNAAQVNSDGIKYVIDSNQYKQGRFIPGCNIEIVEPLVGYNSEPKKIIVFPWNIATEVSTQIRKDFSKFQGEIWKAIPVMTRI